jgi:hypothetical protein
MRKNIIAPSRTLRRAFAAFLSLFLTLTPVAPALAGTQDPVTGAFEGTVSNSQTGAAIAGAVVQFINTVTEVPVAKRTDAQGRFYQGLLQPGVYRIRVSAPGFQTKVVEQRLLATRGNTVVPVPVVLDPLVATTQPTPTQPTQPTQPTSPPATTPATTTPTPAAAINSDITAELNLTDGRRSGAFTEEEVVTLSLGDTTFTRTFDSLALLIPGVALPPQTQGRVSGPGVGAGVGSAGQFAVNGLRSRANNFLVDGSDNNDEDIGVRRQGFFALVPQPPESIKEYQVITALAPAQFGRNIGAQVNAISKSGGYETHGVFYGFLNTSDLNARDYFDTQNAGQLRPLQASAPNGNPLDVYLNNQRIQLRNPAAGKDSLTFAQGGFALGGPLAPRPVAGAEARHSGFYFFSFEGQLLNANKEVSFATPTVEERGILSGATGITREQAGPGFPASLQGDAIFSLFPFPNNPTGIFGRNTFTQVLPASAQGNVASVKFDHNFKLWNRAHSQTGRYNRTDDWRNIPATGDAIFAVLRPTVRTHNFSYFLNSEVSAPEAAVAIFNQFRASYGRTRLNFEEERDREYLIESSILPNTPFLLNAPLLFNFTPPNNTRVDFFSFANVNTELGFNLGRGFGDRTTGALGPIGQVQIAGFSPVGVDVNNFPQRRANNTYQIADILSVRRNTHSWAFGADIRRTELNSDLPRNARPLLTFATAVNTTADCNQAGQCTNARFTNYILPTSLAAGASANNLQQTLALRDSNIGLRYHQYNFFAQDEWRVRPNLSLSYGLRYEYNTPPRERHRVIENSFKDPNLTLPSVSGLTQFIAARDEIFDADRDNFAPRVGLAYSFNTSSNRTTVVRGGYGLYYDQVLGAVVSQSRNVFPNFLTLNTGGGIGTFGTIVDNFIFNPALSLGSAGISNGIVFGDGRFVPFVTAGTLNRFNAPELRLSELLDVFSRFFPGGFGTTLPARRLRSPKAHHFSATIEQQLGRGFVFSLGYVGTRGRNLLRLTTPNLGPNLILRNVSYRVFNNNDPNDIRNLFPILRAAALLPGERLTTDNRIVGGRPTANAGTVFIYASQAESRYDSVQAQIRGRLRNAFQFQLGYTLSYAKDDASDVFDLAGSPALPQNSLAPAGEYAYSNFDALHRLAYSFNWTLPRLSNSGRALRTLLGGFEIAGTGQYQTGQPFTVNAIFDVNLDGNLTDRLNQLSGITRTDDRRRPYSFPNIASGLFGLLAPIGANGSVGRNSFRGTDYLLLNLALVKNFALTERQSLTFRVEAFNFLNRANFALPNHILGAPALGESTDTITSGRRIQFALKYLF